MSLFLQRLLGCAVVAALLLLTPCAHAFEAGAAKVEITPPVGTPLNGYGERQARASVGIHDPLWARCLYLDDGQTDAYLVATDLVFINPELRNRVMELLPNSVVRERVILTATHTHYAQGAMNRSQPYRFVAGAFDEKVLEFTASAIASVIEQAQAAKQRAAIGYATITQTDLTSNRRFKDGSRDEQVGIILVENADGQPISVVANMAAHPTSVPGEFLYHVSADYPGFYYTEMEALAGENCVALFLNGAEGDQTIGSPGGASGWERTESVGKILAQKINEALPAIECREEALIVGHSEPILPLTMADAVQPDRALLKTLEVGNLLMCFMPGEPCVDIGLELRRRSLEAGYAAQFTVGLSNDYLNYFVPPAYYDDLVYENGMNFFGPDIGEFFYREFGQLMTKSPKLPEEGAAGSAQVKEFAGGKLLVLEGSARERGRQRGEAFKDDLRIRFQTQIVEAFVPGVIFPDAFPYNAIPSFIDASSLSSVGLGISSRAQLAGAGDSQRDYVAGMAGGAGLPFDAVWLLQTAQNLPRYEDKAALLNAPLCTMLAVAGERASGGLLIGRNLDWSGKEWPVVLDESGPDTFRSVRVAFTWNAGTFTGMNEHGVAVALQRLPDVAPQPWNETPLEIVLSRVLAETTDLAGALALLKEATASQGMVLVAGLDGEEYSAAVLSYAGKPEVRRPEDGYLAGIAGTELEVDPDTAARYARGKELLSGIEHVAPSDMMAVMSDNSGEGDAQILNAKTAHSVVFEPARRAIHIGFPHPETGAPRYAELLVTGAGTSE